MSLHELLQNVVVNQEEAEEGEGPTSGTPSRRLGGSAVSSMVARHPVSSPSQRHSAGGMTMSARQGMFAEGGGVGAGSVGARAVVRSASGGGGAAKGADQQKQHVGKHYDYTSSPAKVDASAGGSVGAGHSPAGPVVGPEGIALQVGVEGSRDGSTPGAHDNV